MTQIRCICAWCGVVIRDGEEPASHGICARCRAIYFPPSKGWAAEEDEAMTYKQFYEAACALLPKDRPVQVKVETWNYRNIDGRVRTTWTIYDEERCTFYEGRTPEEAIAQCRARIVPDQMPADSDPCAVGE